MRSLTFGSVLGLAGVLAVVGCSLPGEDTASAGDRLDTAAETELQLAKRAVTLLAGSGTRARCSRCLIPRDGCPRSACPWWLGTSFFAGPAGASKPVPRGGRRHGGGPSLAADPPAAAAGLTLF